MIKYKCLNIYCDGGSRGNPGPGAIGVVVKTCEQKQITSFGKVIGVTTNNVAEYRAVIEALKFLKKENIFCELLNFYLDSVLVVNQLKNLYKVKMEHLKKLHVQVKNLETIVSANIVYHRIPRDQNSEADELLNNVLDRLF